MTPWPGAYSFVKLGNTQAIVKIHRAKILEGSSEPAGNVVSAGDGGILVAAAKDGIVLKDIQIAGGKRLTAAEFLRGHPIALGAQLGKAQ